MAKGLGIAGILNKESLAGAKGTHTVVYLLLSDIREHEKNRRYDPAKIERLARSIEDRGLQSPIIVSKVGDGTYVVVSGHRRLAAYRFLLAEGKTEYETIPAIIRISSSEDATEEDLIDGNLFTEMPSPAELAAQLARKKELMLKRKAAGEKIPGKLLDIIAAELGINAEAARRMDTINRRAIEPVKKEFEAGAMSLREAFKTAQLSPSEQEELIEKKTSGTVKHLFPEKKVVHVPPTKERTSPKVVHVPPEKEATVTEVVHVPLGSTLTWNLLDDMREDLIRQDIQGTAVNQRPSAAFTSKNQSCRVTAALLEPIAEASSQFGMKIAEAMQCVLPGDYDYLVTAINRIAKDIKNLQHEFELDAVVVKHTVNDDDD